MLVHSAPRPTPFPRNAELRGAAIASLGRGLPDNVVTNEEIAERLGVDAQWIERRTGVRERYVVRPDETTAHLAARAGSAALNAAGLGAGDLDLVLVGTLSPDTLVPNCSPMVARALGADRAGTIDVGAACSAFLSALALAAGQVETGRADTVLVIGADTLSRLHDPLDRRTAALFADGAGAVVVTATEAPSRIGPFILHAEGNDETIRADWHDRAIRMEGRQTYMRAVQAMSEVTVEVLEHCELDVDDIDLFVYHQANHRIIQAVGEHLGLDAGRVADYVDRYGNTSAATIPLALAAAEQDGRLRRGDRVLLGAFGGGFTWGATIVDW